MYVLIKYADTLIFDFYTKIQNIIIQFYVFYYILNK